MDIGKGDRQPGENKQGRADQKVTANVFADFVRIMLRLVLSRRDVGRVIHRLEQVKERKNENPNQIDKMPEQPRHLNSIRQMLRILAGTISTRPAARNK